MSFYTQNNWLSLKLYKNEIECTIIKEIFLLNLSNLFNITTNKSIICIYKLLNRNLGFILRILYDKSMKSAPWVLLFFERNRFV